MKNITLHYQKILSALLAAVMLLGMTGAAAYADGAAVPPPVAEDAVTETAAPEETTADYAVPPPVEGGEGAPAADGQTSDVPVVEGPGEAVPGVDGSDAGSPPVEVPAEDALPTEEPLAVPPAPGEGLPEEAVLEGEAVDAAETEDELYGSDDPLYIKQMYTPMTIASIPATYDAVTPRALRAGETLRKGVDVSEYQVSNKLAYNIDWNAVKASGIEFAIVRAGYRGVKEGQLAADAFYAQSLSGAKAAGLKVGAYFFSQATTTEEAREEARYLINLVGNISIDLPLVFDYEEVSSANRRLVMSKLDRQLKTDICNAFCQEVEAAGYQSMVYCNPSMLNKDIYRSGIGRLWLAHWTRQSDLASEYEFWQFGMGTVSGIPKEVDLDYWFDPDSLSVPPLPGQAATSPATPTPGPTPTPEPDTAIPPLTENPFSDVKETSWFKESVLWAYGRGIVDGMGDGTFAPGKTATRGQVTTMLYRMMGKPAVTGTTRFTDLKADYYKDAINWAAANKVVNGTGATTFTPNGQITREDLVTMLYRMAGGPAVSGSLGSFSDAGSVHSYARDAMIWAVDKGLIQGYSNNTIQPGTAASRAEVCTLLMRYSNLT